VAALKPWYKVVTPREDLREGKPLDASEFAVHLDQVREGRAPTDYQQPVRFFERTYLTRNLLAFTAEVVRRLSGIRTETSAVFNLSTQFGGGKTHFLTLLYHLATRGPEAAAWNGVPRILEKAGVGVIPRAATAVFVGQKFDALTGRGGDGTLRRLTPWGEIAFQLGGKEAFALVAQHDEQRIAPGGDLTGKLLPQDRPCLILIDELMNFVSAGRKLGMATQTYNFIQNLSEEVRGRDSAVLAVSIPASELDMSAEDVADFQRLDKLLDRLGKAVLMSVEAETSEIVRRRLFEWSGLPDDARKTAAEYARWIVDHRQQLPGTFPVDQAREAFEATYPLHPALLSVFERKWASLQRFQQTRGVLRLLALWVSRAYQDGYKGAHKDPLIGLGTAPLDDGVFRPAVFEQLGESKLEGAVTTDICGKKEAHALQLDKEAEDAVKKARLHRKVATVIFFESNGGQSAHHEATVPEVRLAVAEPDLDIGHVETVLEALSASCYYLTSERHRYRFGLRPNLNKLLADRRANIQPEKVEERVRAEVQKVFAQGSGVERIYFPEKSNQVPEQAALTFVVLAPERAMEDEKKTRSFIETLTREHGASARTFKSALIWCVPESAAPLYDEARKLLAWEDIQDEEQQLQLDDSQKRQLAESVKKAQRDLREAVWRTYKHVLLLGKDNKLQPKDLGLVHSSAAGDLVSFFLSRLRGDGDVEPSVSPTFLVRHWPAQKEWSTRAVRDAFFASPLLPRLLNPESIKETIARGVENAILAYVGKGKGGRYEPFYFGTSLDPDEVEISDEMFVLTAEEAKKHVEPPHLAALVVMPAQAGVEPGKKQTFTAKGLDQHGHDIDTSKVRWTATGGTIDKDGVFAAGQDEGNFLVTASVVGVQGMANVAVVRPGGPPPPPPNEVTGLWWQGQIPPQKWMNFYTKVLSRFATGKGLKVTVRFELSPDGPIAQHKVEETRVALRELGLDDQLAVQ